MQRSNPASRQQALSPEDVRAIRGRVESAARLRTAGLLGLTEAVAPGAMEAMLGHVRARRTQDARSPEIQAALQATADEKRKRKAAKLAKGLKPA